nr:hypothetical protein [Mycoplasmoides genitalium]
MPKVVLEYHKLSKDVVKESLGVEATQSSFNPTQRLKKDSPMKDTGKMGEKLSETMLHRWVVVGLHPLARPLRLRWKKAVMSTKANYNPTTLLKNRLKTGVDYRADNKKEGDGGDLDFLPWIGNGKPFSNSPSPSSSASSTPLPTFSNINVGVKSDITKHLNKENTRWVFIPNFSPDIWTGAGYRKANNNNNGIPFDQVKPSNGSTSFNPTSAGGTQPKKQPPIPFYPTPSVPPVTESMRWLSLIRITRNEISCC